MAAPNTLFALLNLANPEIVKSKLLAKPHWLSLELQPGELLVYTPNGVTPMEVSQQLGINDADATGTALVVKVDSYYGRNFQHLWDWISTKAGVDLGATAS